MVLGAGSGGNIAFNIIAHANLAGVNQTAKALTGLGKTGATAGAAVAQSTKQANTGLQNMQTRADAAAHSLRAISVASAGILGVGVALFKIGANFDEAMDTIRAGTGATGEALTALGEDARSVFREVPTDLQTVATALTELNKRTGDTGQSLQELTKAEIELAEITGTDLNGNIQNTTKLFQQWGIAVDDQVPTLDKLFRAAQATGVTIDTLASNLTQYGPILRTMGFGLDESIALLGTLSKAGVDTGQVITGLRTAIAKFSAEGITDLGTALADVFAQIKNAPSDVAAATIAIDTFGSRAGPALAENIRSGRLEYGDLVETIANGNETIGQATKDTQDFAEKMHILRNRATDALVPLGTQMFDALNALIPAMTKVSEGIEFLGNAFAKLPEPAKAVVAAAIVAVGAIAGISFVTATVAGVVTTASAAVVGLATSMGLISATAPEAAASIAAVGIAAEGTTVAVTELAIAEDAAAAGSVTAATRIGALTASLTSLARVASIGIIIGIGGPLLVDSVQNALSGQDSELEGIGRSIVGKVADGIREVGATQIANALDQAVGQAAENATVRDFSVAVGLTVKPGDPGFADTVQQSIVHALPGGGLIPDSWITDVDHANDMIEELNVTVGAVQKRAAEAGISFQEELLREADQMGVTTPALEEYRKSVTSTVTATGDLASATEDSTGAIDDQTVSIADQVAESIKAKEAQDQLSKAIQAAENEQFLASGTFDDWMLPFIKNSEDAQKTATDLTKGLDTIISTSLNASRGVSDLSSELPGLQAGFGKVGESITDIFRHMDDIGVINLDPSSRAALDAASALDKVEAKITLVEAAISNNQGDLAMWQSRISLVTDTFGANQQQISDWLNQLQTGIITQDQFNANIASLASAGGFPKLDALLAQGKITQGEYNDAVAAGTHLLQRSAGGLQDEGAEIVRNIISLDAYARAHDTADGAVRNLSDAQRGFLLTLQTTPVQDYLNTLQLLQSLGLPKEVITKFILDSGTANKDIANINTSLGLVDGDHVANIDVKTTTDGTPIDTDIAQPAAIDFKANDKVTPVVDTINTNVAQWSANMVTQSDIAGQGVETGVGNGFAGAANAAGQGIVRLLQTLDQGGTFYNFGFNDGFSFGVGVANGITATANSVYNAAFNVGFAAMLGFQAGQGSGQASAAISGQSVGSASASPMASMARGDQRAQSVLAASSTASAPASSSRVVNINLGGIHGITDPGAVSERVVTDLYRALDRHDASGLFGR